MYNDNEYVSMCVKVPIGHRRLDFTRIPDTGFREERCVKRLFSGSRPHFSYFLSFTGYLTKKELESSLTGSGEPFSTDEMEEMWTAIKALRFPSDSDRVLPSDAFDYSLYAKYMMK
jgi:hypothetical protein